MYKVYYSEDAKVNEIRYFKSLKDARKFAKKWNALMDVLFLVSPKGSVLKVVA